MSAEARHYDDLHRQVDRLEPDQAEAMRAVVDKLVADEPATVSFTLDGASYEIDLSNEHAVETVSFAIDGVAYEVDLTNEDASRLRNALTAFVASARRVAGRKRPRRQFSFAGSISAEPDFAVRSEEILDEIANRNTP